MFFTCKHYRENDLYNNNNIFNIFKVKYPMYIDGLQQIAFTIIKKDHNINNYNACIVVYSQHPYCCENNIILTLFLKNRNLMF